MKKLVLMLAAAMLTVSASAQKTAITGNKAGDNWYVGVNAGIATQMKKHNDNGGFFKAMAPTFGVRLGKNFTTVFGLAAEGDIIFKSNKKFYDGRKTFVEQLNVDLLGTFNLSNAFLGYKGEPRAFELIALGGFGWGHGFNHLSKNNALTSKVALDFAFNLGADKKWQVYVEPALNYVLIGKDDEFEAFKYDINRSLFTLKAGVNYKFGTSNGTHNFAKVALRDQAEIDGLNSQINSLRADNQAKDGQIATSAKTIADLQAQNADLKKKLADCEARPVGKPVENVLQPHVIFRQGKSTIDAAQYASIEMVAKYMKNHKDAKVKIQGYASPEGKKEFNQKLSEKRAEVVKNALVKKYKIAADRITCEGLGATDKLSSENDFNRVAMFIDTTK